MSVYVTGDGAWGPEGGGVFGKAGALYDLPVRSGVGDGPGVGCWQTTDRGATVNNSNCASNRKEIGRIVT
jgi:hypothetical protein